MTGPATPDGSCSPARTLSRPVSRPLWKSYSAKRSVIHGAGRTDAGVHALGQVAAFDAPRHFDPIDLRRALNAMLPPDIAVREAVEAASRFDPRRDAYLRAYEYRILNRELRSVFDHRYAWHVREALDLDAMRTSARRFLGEHDFAAFRTLGTETKSTVRRIYVSQWEQRGDLLRYRVEGSSFLRHMVRAMVAAMVEIGRKRMSVAALDALLEQRRSRCGAGCGARWRPVPGRSALPAASRARAIVEILGAQGQDGAPVQKTACHRQKMNPQNLKISERGLPSKSIGSVNTLIGGG